MRMALREAERAAEEGEVPAGAVVVAPAVLEPSRDGRPPVYDFDPSRARILGRARNMSEGLADATAHAEMLAICAASAALGAWRLRGAFLYATKEPCPMCAGAISLARLDSVVWGVPDPKRGGSTVFGILSHPGMNHRPELVPGVMADEAAALLKDFFAARRGNKEKKEELS